MVDTPVCVLLVDWMTTSVSKSRSQLVVESVVGESMFFCPQVHNMFLVYVFFPSSYSLSLFPVVVQLSVPREKECVKESHSPNRLKGKRTHRTKGTHTMGRIERFRSNLSSLSKGKEGATLPSSLLPATHVASICTLVLPSISSLLIPIDKAKR